jgi:hypothetical protein
LLSSQSEKRKRRVGQPVKTPPFHGGITGSIPVHGTRLNETPLKFERRFYVFETIIQTSIYLYLPFIVVIKQKIILNGKKTYQNLTEPLRMQFMNKTVLNTGLQDNYNYYLVMPSGVTF